MSVVMSDTPLNIGTSSVLAIAALSGRKALLINNKHATQTVRVKFGSAIQGADVTQQQLITFGSVPDAGTFKLTWGGNQTAAIDNSAVASDVQTAIRALTGLSSITVAGDFTVGFTVTMTSVSNLTPTLPAFTVTQNSLTTAAVPVVITVAITVAALYADGMIIAANSTVNLSGQSCPQDAIYMLASGANTRVDVLQG